MNAPLTLSSGYSLNTMRARLMLKARPGICSLNHKCHLSKSTHIGGLAREQFDLPATCLRIVQVHAVEIPGPDVSFVATLSSANLDNDILPVIWILGD